MKKKNSGCCFLVVCILFLLPGILLLKERLPEAAGLFSEIRTVLRDPGEHAGGKETIRQEESSPAVQTETAVSVIRSDNGCSYYYWMLSEPLQAEYMTLLDGLLSMDSEISLSLDEEMMKILIKAVFADHPELFWVEQSYEYSLYSGWVQLRPRYTCSREEQEQRALQVEQTVREALGQIPEGSSVYETTKALYAYVVETVEYELDSPDNQNIYSSMVNRVSVCTGYAKELQYLLQRAGIQAVFVEGNVTDRGPHAWLISCCEGEYYHIDPTFGDPSYSEGSEENPESLPEEFQVDYTYLCCNDEMILRERQISEDLAVPECVWSTFLYYPMQGRYFQTYSEAVTESIRASLERGERHWEGQFGDWQAYQDMITHIQEGVYGDMVLENYSGWGSVTLHMSFSDSGYVVKLWY